MQTYEQHVHYFLRTQDAIGRLGGRTGKFQSSFYPNCISEWNKLDPEIRNVPPIGMSKTNLLSILRPPVKSIYGIHDPIGLSYLSQIRVCLSKLNFHKFKHNFKDTINPMCLTNDGIEDTEHVLLLFLSFDNQRQHLLAGISVAVRPFAQLNILSNHDLINILLYSTEDLPSDINKRVLEYTIHFIHETGRFN